MQQLDDPDVILEIFDMGVNAGKRNAIRIAQRLVGVKADGIIGFITAGAIYKCNDFVFLYKLARKDYYTNLVIRKPDLEIFLQGWLNRVDSTHF